MISFKFREFIKDEWVRASLDALFAELRGFLSTSFDSDGNLIVATPTGVVPVGAMMEWGTAVAPALWVVCDGSQVSRVTYKTLFEVIGTTYGVGDGSTTFNVPDFRERMAIGKGGVGAASVLAATGGAFDHTHTGAAHTHSTPAHAHAIALTSASGGSHDHGGATSSAGGHDHAYSGTTSAENTGATPVVLGADIDVALFNHHHTYSGTTDSVANHSHTINNESSHTHGVSGNTDTSGSGTTGSASAGSTGANNPPFLVITKIIYAGV